MKTLVIVWSDQLRAESANRNLNAEEHVQSSRLSAYLSLLVFLTMYVHSKVTACVKDPLTCMSSILVYFPVD